MDTVDVCGLGALLTPSFAVACDNGGTVTTDWTGSGLTFVDDSAYAATCGTYTATFTVNNGLCSASGDVVIRYYDVPDVDAGQGFDYCGTVTAGIFRAEIPLLGSYTASCTNGVDPMVNWSVYSGPAGAAVIYMPGNDTIQNLAVVDKCGIYKFLLTVENGAGCVGADTVVHIVYDMPEIEAGQDQDVCGTTAILNPSWSVVCDNGNPVTTYWASTGPGNATFDGDTVSVDVCGAYEFIYIVTNTTCTAWDTLSVNFFDVPVVDAGLDMDICGLEALLAPSFTVQCENSGTATGVWSGAGLTFNGDTATASVCGTYTATYTVTNGPCTESDDVEIKFYDTPEFVMQGVPDAVCGFTSDPFEVFYTVACGMGDTAWWTTTADSIVMTGTNMWTAYAPTCGTYDFTYHVENGPCTADSTFQITFYATPEPEISGPDTVYTCSSVEYTVTDPGCNDMADMRFDWYVDGNFVGHGTSITVDWDQNANAMGLVHVWAGVIGLEDVCNGTDNFDVYKMHPTVEGQIKYWNEYETFMPTPFAAECGCDYPFDYFYLNTWQGADTANMVYQGYIIVEPSLEKNLLSYFEFEINTTDYGCDAVIETQVFDGGFLYNNDAGDDGILAHNYTYNHWGGVNATDALAIQMMSSQMPLPYAWVGDATWTPNYGLFSNQIANVNNSMVAGAPTITALDALTANYRSVGLIPLYPDNGTANMFYHNFAVSARMLNDATELPVITFPTPFGGTPVAAYTDIENNLFGSENYEFYTEAEDHWYQLDIPWEAKANLMNIYYEAIGDVNASYVPTNGPFKAEPNMELVYEEVVYTAVDNVMTIPVSIDRDAEIGAISLSFNYRNDLIEVIGTSFSEDDVFINHEEGILNMGWFSINAIDVEADETIAQIRVRVLAEIPANTELFELNVNTELADATATPINDISLKSIGITTDKDFMTSTELTSSNYPNPFTNATTISYMLPESGKVKISVFNNMGVLVTTLVDEVLESGIQNIVFDADVNAGVYFYNITLQGESGDYSTVKRMIVVN